MGSGRDDAVGISVADDRPPEVRLTCVSVAQRALGGRLIVNSGSNGAHPSAFINVMWMGIGLYDVVRGARSGSKRAA